MPKKVGMRALTVCRLHADAIIFHNNDIVCPYCVSKEIQKTIQEDYEVLQAKYETATGNCAGSF